MYHLIVRSSFGGYEAGALIADADEVKRILGDVHLERSVVKVPEGAHDDAMKEAARNDPLPTSTTLAPGRAPAAPVPAAARPAVAS